MCKKNSLTRSITKYLLDLDKKGKTHNCISEDTAAYANNQKGSFSVKADLREDASGIANILTDKYHLDVQREYLHTGDYIIDGTIAVERKTAVDFVQSIIDGRLFHQAVRMKKYFRSSIIIIEGDLYTTSFDIHPHAIKGALVNLSLIWRIPVIFSENKEDTAFLLWLIGTQYATAVNEWYHRPGRRPKQFHRQRLFVLQGFPGVGPKLARQLLEHFGSIEKIITASVEELMKVPMIGKAKADKIKEIVL